MIPKEKAKELVDKMFWQQSHLVGNPRVKVAKQCASICVDEIIKELYFVEEYLQDVRLKYLEEVKQEIENYT